jgi:3-methyladenine DNA glycosylase/8-oxoguanine DNA glycosylase
MSSTIDDHQYESGVRLAREHSFVIAPKPPFSFRLTVRKPAGWTLFNDDEIYERGVLWTATRFGPRIVGIKLGNLGTVSRPKILVTLYTKKKLARTTVTGLKEALETFLGTNEDMKPFYAMARKDPILKHVVEDLLGMHDTQTPYLFNSVVLSICLQMAKLDRSERMMEAISRRYGATVKFDGKQIRVNPSAETIAKLNPSDFAKKCNLGYRAKYIVESAKMLSTGFPDTLELMRMEQEEAKEKLMQLPGVGDYAADIINPGGGFPVDAWSVDVFGKLFFGREPKNARESIEVVKKEGVRRWGESAWYAFFYVAQDLRNLSKRLKIQLRMQ